MAKRKASKKAKRSRSAKAPTKRTPNARARTRKPKKASSPPDWRDRWLQAFHDTRCVAAACEETGIGRATVYKRRDDEPDFAEAWDEIKATRGAESLRGVMLRQAIEGTEGRPVAYTEIEEVRDAKGKLVSTKRTTKLIQVREFDGANQRFLLAKMLPEEFGRAAEDRDETVKERAAVACAIMAAMRDSVPLFEEPEE